ncbi:hypothetical protein GOV09_00180 [Candidatus Woesearchaeota archaeon]|nr:hypothetical protein [Candidatus Woesearchaeota archaeon]
MASIVNQNGLGLYITANLATAAIGFADGSVGSASFAIPAIGGRAVVEGVYKGAFHLNEGDTTAYTVKRSATALIDGGFIGALEYAVGYGIGYIVSRL